MAAELEETLASVEDRLAGLEESGCSQASTTTVTRS